MQLNMMPPSKNVRSRVQWSILTHFYDFKGKSVLDLGCGYADIIMHCSNSGGTCQAVDRDQGIITRNEGVCKQYGLTVDFQCMEIDQYMKANDSTIFDAVICFSVIPYLYNERLGVSVFQWLARNAKTAFLEIQYRGDGPGLEFIEGDQDMEAFLSNYFNDVRAIGKTFIPDRDKYRTIWKCE